MAILPAGAQARWLPIGGYAGCQILNSIPLAHAQEDWGKMSPHVGRCCRILTGLDGSPLSMADLPALKTEGWVTRRKAVVVACLI